MLATMGMGCFWCAEALFHELHGVKTVASGYAGGTVQNPSYEEVCAGGTGHAEVVQIRFDPRVISYETLLSVFWRFHDPTTPNRQGADVGSQYRSIIIYHDEQQRQSAEQSKETAEKLWQKPVVTEIVPYTVFYPAEHYHKNYYREHADQPYCRFVIDPKLMSLRAKLPSLVREEGS
ncbi:MAG: peptide-methionine (S)-S-oxide reductase MsrA [Candidatus Omnitrophica bacterium]|nr:peptide-methionine (S)-S-oxide reductase MsrA [Candidatus Omnitrophota bacterium]